MKLFHVRIGREVTISNAITFMARDRTMVEEAYAGDIIGLHNHGTMRIGDTFTQKEPLRFGGIPNFAPEIFRRTQIKNPMKMKALQKGLEQLTEEGATQLFRPLANNELILGAVGVLQFDVVAHRLQHEYGVDAVFEPVQVATARWISCQDEKMLNDFEKEAARQPRPRRRWRADLPRAVAREPAADHGTLAGRHLQHHARAGLVLEG